jgi:hypothetical protein
MKSRRIFIVFVCILSVIVAVFLMIQAGQPDAFEEMSRFARLGPEGGPSEAQVQEILEQSSSGPIVVASIQNDESAPLSQIEAIPPKQSRPDPDLNELRPLPKRGNGPKKPAPGRFVDPVLQASARALNIAAPLQNFEALSNVNGVLPPDTNGDVGPNHYMQWVNLSFAIYSKNGTLIYGPAAGNTLWSGFGGACQTSNDGDPIVQYDHLADRWMVSQFALPNYPSGPFYQCIAVSQTGDPTGAWYRYQFQISATKVNDYPHFGVWPDGYYMSVNQFVGNNWGGAGVVVFERQKMLLGQPARSVYFDLFSVDPNLGGMLPSDLDGQAPPAGMPNYYMEVDDDGYGFPQDQLNIWQFSVNWSNPSASSFTHVTSLATAAFDSDMCIGSRNCIPQQGTTRGLDALADRLMYRLQYRNFGAYQTIVASHTVDVDDTDRAGIRWYELRNSGSGWSIHQQGTFSPDSTRRWLGSAAMDAGGNIAIGYSASSSTMYPAIRYTGRLAGDPPGTLSQGEGTLFAGTGAQTNSASRWGDYSMLSVDPVDSCTFWYTNEYIQTTGQSTWHTRIGSFQLPGCGSSPSTPTPSRTPGLPTPTQTNTPTLTQVPPTATSSPTRTATYTPTSTPPAVQSSPPVISSITRADPDPTGAAIVNFTVTLSKVVTGLQMIAPFHDFALYTTGVTGASITGVSGTGNTYTVRVNTGSGYGAVRLDVVDNNSIIDLSGNPLGGVNLGDGNYQSGEVYTINKTINATFADVPATHPYFNDIEILYANGLTGGCSTSPLKYCPDQTMNRGEAAVFILRGNYGSSFVPGPAVHFFKDDWSKGTWAEPWAEAMYNKGLSAGCSPSPAKYCPWDQIPREQAVIFALRLMHGNNYLPPAATGTLLADMKDVNYYATSWTEQAYKDGLIPSCGTSAGKPMICPKALVSRGLGAYMIVRARNLTMP